VQSRILISSRRVCLFAAALWTLSSRSSFAWTDTAYDDSADPAYDASWNTGDDGGFGFTPWVLAPAVNQITSGFFTASATLNGSPSSGGTINASDGDSWGMYANHGGVAAAYRGLDFNGDGLLDDLPVHSTVHACMDNGWNDGSVGIILRAGNSIADRNQGRRFEFFHAAGGNYQLADAGGTVDTGMPWTPDGLELDFTLTGPDSYFLHVRPIGGTGYTRLGTLDGTGPIQSLAFYNENAGEGAPFDLFFNGLAVESGLAEPEALGLSANGGSLDLEFEGVSNASYRIEMSTNLLDRWSHMEGVIPGGGSTLVSLSPTGQASVVYYRAAVESAVSFLPNQGRLTNGIQVVVPLQFVPGLLGSNQSVTVELVAGDGTSYGRTEIHVDPDGGAAYTFVNLPVDHDLPFGDHTWTLRAYVGNAATGTWDSASARWSEAMEVQVFPSFLSTSGRHVVDELGRRVNLRGVNAGAWLVYEDWMLGFAPEWVNEFSIREWLKHKSLGGHLFPVFEAERYNASQGVANHGEYIGSFDAGDWIVFSNMVFEAGVRGMYLNVAASAAGAGKQIEVRLNSAGGPLLGTATVKDTGGYFTWNRQYLPFASPVTGTNDLYFVAAGGGGVANFNWFQLDLARREAEQFDAMQGVSPVSDHVASFDPGDWFAFSNVNFGVGCRGLVVNLAVDPAFAGQRIELRLDGPDGELAGTHVVKPTAGWIDYRGQFADFTQEVSGVRDLYLVAQGDLGNGVANVNWFKVVSDGLLKIFQDAFLTEADLDDIQALNYNVLRLPYPDTLLEDDEAPFDYKEAGWERLDWLVEQCRRRGLYLLLGMHASPGGHNPFDHNGQKDRVSRLWEDFWYEPADPCGGTLDNGPCFRERTEQMWDAISERYKANPTVVGYGLLNEPIADYGGQIAPFTARLYDTIRGNGDNHLIFVMNPNFGQITGSPEQPNDMFGLIPDVHGNGWFGVLYEYHPYRYILDPFPDASFDIQKASADLLCRQYDYVSHFRQTPVFLGEFMPGSRRNFDYYSRQFNAYDVNWTHWSYKQMYGSDWGLLHRSQAWDQVPNLDVDDAATLATKLASYQSGNYSHYDLLRSVLGRNAGDTNTLSYRTEFYSRRFAAPDAGANSTWPFDGLEIQSDWLNGGFEFDGLGAPGGAQLYGWQLFGNGQRANYEPRSGTYHAQVWGQGAGWPIVNFSGIEQRQAARPGQVWQGTVYALLPGDHPVNNNRIKLQLEFYSDPAAQPGDLLGTAGTEVEAWWWSLNTYNFLQVRSIAPEDTRTVKLVASYQANPFQNGSVYFDDARLEWLQGASTPDLLNAGFENGIGGSFDTWTFTGDGQRANFQPRSGGWHAHLWGSGVGGSTTSTSKLVQVVQAYVRQGEPWRAEVFARPLEDEPSANKVRVAFEFYSDAVAAPTNLVSSHTFDWEMQWIAENKYDPLRVEGLAPTTGTVAIKFTVAFLNEPGTPGAVVLDDAALVNRSTDRPNVQIETNLAKLLLNGGPAQIRFRSRKEADARFEINDVVGSCFSVAISNIVVDTGGAAALNLCALRDAVTRKVYEYNTQGLIARLLYRDDTPGTQVTVQVYAKNWDLNTLGNLLYTSAAVAFEPGARFELEADDSTVSVQYGSSIDWSGGHGLNLDDWVNGAVGVLELEDAMPGGDSEYILLNEIKAQRLDADTSRVFHETFETYPQSANFTENTQYWTQSDDASFVSGGQWLWKPNNWHGAQSWLNPRWDYHDPVRLDIASGWVADVRAEYRGFNDWDAIAKICLVPESFTGTIYGEYAGPALYLEISRNGANPGNMWFRLFRHNGVGGDRSLVTENNGRPYVDGRVVSLQVSTNNAAVYYGSDLLFNTAHGVDVAEVFADGAIPHLEFQRANQDYLFLDDVDCRERVGFTTP